MKNKIIIGILIFSGFIFNSCNTSRRSSEPSEPIPEWVVRKPQSPMYYIGVSSASKIGASPNEYITSAQQRALGDLASSISVNIESTSMLSIIETNYNISENFSRDITASTSKELEGYELVDAWEDGNNYWVYYRLSRETYHRIRQEKKNKAISDAKNKYARALDMFDRNSHYQAVKFYAEALEDLKMYLGESTVTEIAGKQQDLGNYVFNRIADFLTELQIYHPKNEIKVKRGVTIDPDLLTFKIMDQNNVPVSDIPFRVSFTGPGLLRNSEISDSDGRITCAIRQFTSAGDVETLRLSVDMQNFSRISTDPMIRNIIRNMPAPTASLRIIIQNPTLYISSSEKEFNNVRTLKELKNSLIGNLGGSFMIIDDRSQADFIIDIDSNTAKKGTYLNEHYVTMRCSINMTDNRGNNVFRRNISNDHMGHSYENASSNAYRETARTIERRTAADIINTVR